MGSCPKELKLNKENSDKLEALFLDFQIEIENGKFMLGLFDKRGNFPFSIVRMPYKPSNLPSIMFYTSAGARSLRIAKAIITLTHFIHLRSHY